MTESSTEKVLDFLKHTYKEVCQDDEDRRGFTTIVRHTNDEHMPTHSDCEESVVLILQDMVARLGDEKATSMFRDYVWQYNDWDQFNGEYRPFEIPWKVHPAHMRPADIEQSEKVVKSQFNSFNHWVFGSETDGRVYHLRRTASQVSRILVRLDEGLHEEFAQIPTPYGVVRA